MERISYVHMFISALYELLEPFHKPLKKGVSSKWGEERQAALSESQDCAQFISNYALSNEGFASSYLVSLK